MCYRKPTQEQTVLEPRAVRICVLGEKHDGHGAISINHGPLKVALTAYLDNDFECPD